MTKDTTYLQNGWLGLGEYIGYTALSSYMFELTDLDATVMVSAQARTPIYAEYLALKKYKKLTGREFNGSIKLVD